jgi:hypothetical protein
MPHYCTSAEIEQSRAEESRRGRFWVGGRGRVRAVNSVLGGIDVGLAFRSVGYDPTRQRIAVGRPAENLLSLLTLGPVVDELFADGFEG